MEANTVFLPSLEQSCTGGLIGEMGQELHFVCPVRNSAPLQRLPLAASLYTVLLYSYEGFCFRAITTKSPNGWPEPGKNYLLKAVYLINIDFCFKFLSAVHYLTSSTDCPNSANISLTLFSQILNSCLRIIFIIWQVSYQAIILIPPLM